MNKKNNVKRIRVLGVIALLVVVCVASISGTIAWLTDKTDPVKNVFAPTDLGITLTETLQSDGKELEENEKWSAELVPGVTYDKNPVVGVDANSEKCWLFVKVTETNRPSNYLEYSYIFDNGSGWKQLTGDGVPNDVWYLVVDESTTEQKWALIDENKVTVKKNVSKEAMEDMTDEADYPSIAFTAYAIQYAGYEPAVTEGKTEPTDVQISAAALKAWNQASDD